MNLMNLKSLAHLLPTFLEWIWTVMLMFSLEDYLESSEHLVNFELAGLQDVFMKYSWMESESVSGTLRQIMVVAVVRKEQLNQGILLPSNSREEVDSLMEVMPFFLRSS